MAKKDGRDSKAEEGNRNRARPGSVSLADRYDFSYTQNREL